MQKFSRVIIGGVGGLLAISGAFIGCSGGGLSTPSGKQCIVGYDPIPMRLGPGQENLKLNKDQNADAIRKDPSNTQVLKPGNYVYAGADIFYLEDINDVDNKLQIHVKDDPTEDGANSHTSIACLRNAKPNMTGYVVQVEGVSDIQVDNNYNMKVLTRSFGFDITQSKITMPPPAKGTAVLDSADIPYNKATQKDFSDVMTLKIDDSNYQIRTRFNSDNGATYFLSVRLVKKP